MTSGDERSPETYVLQGFPSITEGGHLVGSPVRDVGVAGSNPATPTILSLKASECSRSLKEAVLGC